MLSDEVKEVQRGRPYRACVVKTLDLGLIYKKNFKPTNTVYKIFNQKLDDPSAKEGSLY